MGQVESCMSPPQILIVDLEADPCLTGNCGHLRALIEKAFPTGSVCACENAQVLEAIPKEPDLVVFRPPANLPLLQIVRSLRERWKAASAVAVLCRWSEPAADLLESLLHGLDDFFCCPIRDIEIIPRVRRLLPGVTPNGGASGRLRLETLIGESECFLAVVEKVPRVAKSDATALISGETGTGKELFARAIHYNGARQSNPFVPLNCGAVPDHLFENELFGHARGAYTDASQTENGLLAEAEGGSLFLDEVDTLTASAQAKLLRFLQDREYKPLGSTKSLAANVRVIAAANTDLRERVKTHLFREDLFHRLNILTVDVPPLRNRGGDIPLLAKHFLARYESLYGRSKMTFSRAVLSKLMNYRWPGNVRELESLVHRAVVLTPLDVLQPQNIDLPVQSQPDRTDDTLQAAKSRAIQEFEHSYLSNLLAANNGNVSRAAQAAGKDRRALQRMIRKHGLASSSFRYD